MIAILDYGAGNVGSVMKAIRYLGHGANVITAPEQVAQASKLILPGQGHFGAMMKSLRERQAIAPLREAIAAGKPFLGICLGLQALFESSEEAADEAGLGLLPGQVRRFEGVFKVPHVGWSQLEIRHPDGILRGVPTGSFVYFCHSYYGPVTPHTGAVTEYGQAFSAVVEKDSLAAVQFHPEKSGDVGLEVLKNFLEK
jgi:imidazole glycerol phosphate synthase glutamine amidotransferase subunit